MGAIVSLTDLANSLDSSVVNARGNHLIDLAEGLVIEKIGDWAPWTPAVEYATPRAVVLAAAGRPLRNPKGVRAKSVDAVRDDYGPEQFGVYLEDTEIQRLAEWLKLQQPATDSSAAPVGSFDDPLDYPDPARGPRWTGSALTDYGL